MWLSRWLEAVGVGWMQDLELARDAYVVLLFFVLFLLLSVVVVMAVLFVLFVVVVWS